MKKKILEKYTFIDLFAGIGAFHQAFSSYGCQCIFASEFDKNCQNIYQKNYKISPEGDITKIPESSIPKHDILCAGFPCQAFSISGKQMGFNDTRGTLFFDILRIATYHNPKIIFLENVPQILRHDKGNTFSIIRNSLEKIGYDVYYQILNSSNFGVPQSRKRIYVLGFKKELGIKNFFFPLGHNTPTQLIDVCLPDSETKNYIINRNDIRINDNVDLKPDIFRNYPQTPIRIGTINKGGQGERIYHSYGHSITLSAYGGGVGAKTGVYLINNKVRKLTPRECARLMGFSDDFVISEKKNIAYKQFGNSIVINVLTSIIKKIALTLETENVTNSTKHLIG